MTKKDYFFGPGIFFFTVVSCLALFGHGSHWIPSGALLDTTIQEIQKANAQIILIGNSILDHAIDENIVSEELGCTTYKHAVPGSASASWHLSTKNILPKLSQKPEWVIVFFRDDYLSKPRYRVYDYYYKKLLLLTHTPEPLLEQLAYQQTESPLADLLYRNLGFFRKRRGFRNSFENYAKYVSNYLADSNISIRKASSRVFARVNMDPELLQEKTTAAERHAEADQSVFQNQRDTTFLPAIISNITSQGSRPIFVRLMRRRDGKKEPQAAWLIQYMNELKQYLDAQGIPLIDLSSVPGISEELFTDGDHLRIPDGRRIVSSEFARRLLPLLENGVHCRSGARVYPNTTPTINSAN